MAKGKKIRVSQANSKVLDGRLYISLLKAQSVTSKVLAALIEYGNYMLEIKINDLIENKFTINGTRSFENIETNPQSIILDINDNKNNNTRQFGGGGFGGALLTTGSFTMMAASGGF